MRLSKKPNNLMSDVLAILNFIIKREIYAPSSHLLDTFPVEYNISELRS